MHVAQILIPSSFKCHLRQFYCEIEGYFSSYHWTPIPILPNIIPSAFYSSFHKDLSFGPDQIYQYNYSSSILNGFSLWHPVVGKMLVRWRMATQGWLSIGSGYLMAPIRYPNQCWPIIRFVLWHSQPLYHTWVWNRGICRCVIVRPRSHMLIVRRKIVPITTTKCFTFSRGNW